MLTVRSAFFVWIALEAIFALGELNWLMPAKFASQGKLPAGSRGGCPHRPKSEYNFAQRVSAEFSCEVIKLLQKAVI